MKTIKFIKYLITICFGMLLLSCQDLNPVPDDDPTELTHAPAKNVLTTIQLYNLSVQTEDLAFTSAVLTRQITSNGLRVEQMKNYKGNRYPSLWTELYTVLINNQVLGEIGVDDLFLVAIGNIMAADALRTGANIYGDIPYSEMGDPLEYPLPKLDNQLDIYAEAIRLLESALVTIEDFASSGTSGSFLPNDLFYGGDAAKWLEAANSILARTYLEMKDYPNALFAAKKGISTSENNLQWATTSTLENVTDHRDKNFWWNYFWGNGNGTRRYGEMTLEDTYFWELLKMRENDKTKESARASYYSFSDYVPAESLTIVGAFEPQKIITYHETLLMIAECAARAGDLSSALNNLNLLRYDLINGQRFRGDAIGLSGRLKLVNIIPDNLGDEKVYDAYILADFEPGGMENQDNITTDRALLREIFEERYVSLFLTIMPFSDARRLRKTDADIAVPFLSLETDPPVFLERIPYPARVSRDNPNIPYQSDDADPSIFIPTQINQ